MICLHNLKKTLNEDKGIIKKPIFVTALFLIILHGCNADFEEDSETDIHGNHEPGRVFASPTPDISIPKGCFAPNAVIVITKHNPSSNPSKDWIWVPEDGDWWVYMPQSEYLYDAPEQSGSYELRFYWNDGEDKDWRSRLTFQVSASCP